MNFNQNLKYLFQWISRRQQIFWNRIQGKQLPYTDDQILRAHKFTNVYRALDRESQYMIKNVIYNGKQYTPKDMFWRILLFRHFNKGQTWDYLIKNIGDITYSTPKDEIIKCLNRNPNKNYSGAYMLSASFVRNDRFVEKYNLKKGQPKYEAYLKVFFKYFKEENNIDKVLTCNSLEILYNTLRIAPAFANFLSMQLATDLNWSPLFDFDENDFVVASVGSLRGIKRTFDIKKNTEYNEIIYWTHHNFTELMNYYGFEFKPLPNRMPTLMDVQNCFCETDKYLRGLGVTTRGVHGKRIKGKFKPNPIPIKYTFPPKWNIPDINPKRSILYY